MTLHRDAQGTSLQPTIAKRSFRLDDPDGHMALHFLHLAGGQASLQTGDEQEQLATTLLLIAPHKSKTTLSLDAGTHGILFHCSAELLQEAIGDSADAEALRRLANRRTLVDELSRDDSAAISNLLSSAILELQNDRPGARMAITAYIRLVLLQAWRLSGMPDADHVPPIAAGAAALLEEFRRLIDAQHRQHQAVSTYASQLGITSDRLHDLCRRKLGKSPIELVHERMLFDAKLRLERSTRSIQEIADSLGFRDATYFSHFFKRHTGLAPRAYRTMAQANTAMKADPPAINYAAWP